jgi:predicted porin
MKKTLIAAAALAMLPASAAYAQNTVHVRGHVRTDGVYVPAHTRTAPNSSRTDNWSSQGNVNPRTGASGTVDPYAPKPFGSSSTTTRTKSPWGN